MSLLCLNCLLCIAFCPSIHSVDPDNDVFSFLVSSDISSFSFFQRCSVVWCSIVCFRKVFSTATATAPLVISLLHHLFCTKHNSPKANSMVMKTTKSPTISICASRCRRQMVHSGNTAFVLHRTKKLVLNDHF